MADDLDYDSGGLLGDDAFDGIYEDDTSDDDDYDEDYDDDESFESSSVPQPSLYAVGQIPANSNPDQTRLALKDFQARLSFLAGNAQKVSQDKLWSTRFQEFRSDILEVDPNSTPTGDDLEQFLPWVAAMIRKSGKDEAVSWGTVTRGIGVLKNSFTLNFKDFSLTQHEEKRIDNALQLLLQNGILTKERKRGKRQWVTSDIVHLLVRNMFQQAVLHGTSSWDILIMKMLAIVLQSATVCRAGEIRQDRRMGPTVQCLCWEHITIELQDVEDREVLVATVMLRYTKYLRDDPDHNITHQFSELDDHRFNSVCPVKLLLVHALRQGAVAETSWDQLNKAVRMRRNKRVLWTTPERPVICRTMQLGKALQMDLAKPAPANGATVSIQEAARSVGLLTKIVPHDLRRGGAREVAHLGAPGDFSLEAARIVMGHSHDALHRGHTQLYYVDHISHDYWKERLEKPLPRSPNHALEFAPLPFQRTRPPADEVEAICQQKEWDFSNTYQRGRASRIVAEEHYQVWRSEHLAKQGAISQVGIKVDNEASGRLEPTGSEKRHPVIMNMVSKFGLENHEVSMLSILDEAPDDFAQFLSSVNTYSVDNNYGNLPHVTMSGGSRDSPTVFIHYCPRSACDKSFTAAYRLAEHLKHCKGDPVAYPFRCTICNKGCKTAQQLHIHLRSHKWEPQGCNWPGCEDDETVYPSASQLTVHRQIAHFGQPTYCWVDDCTGQREHTTPGGLKAHIRNLHPEITEEEIARHFPAGHPRRWAKGSIKPSSKPTQEESEHNTSHPNGTIAEPDLDEDAHGPVSAPEAPPATRGSKRVRGDNGSSTVKEHVSTIRRSKRLREVDTPNYTRNWWNDMNDNL